MVQKRYVVKSIRPLLPNQVAENCGSSSNGSAITEIHMEVLTVAIELDRHNWRLYFLAILPSCEICVQTLGSKPPNTATVKRHEVTFWHQPSCNYCNGHFLRHEH